VRLLNLAGVLAGRETGSWHHKKYSTRTLIEDSARFQNQDGTTFLAPVLVARHHSLADWNSRGAPLTTNIESPSWWPFPLPGPLLRGAHRLSVAIQGLLHRNEEFGHDWIFHLQISWSQERWPSHWLSRRHLRDDQGATGLVK